MKQNGKNANLNDGLCEEKNICASKGKNNHLEDAYFLLFNIIPMIQDNPVYRPYPCLV